MAGKRRPCRLTAFGSALEAYERWIRAQRGVAGRAHLHARDVALIDVDPNANRAEVAENDQRFDARGIQRSRVVVLADPVLHL